MTEKQVDILKELPGKLTELRESGIKNLKELTDIAVDNQNNKIKQIVLNILDVEEGYNKLIELLMEILKTVVEDNHAAFCFLENIEKIRSN